MPQRSLVTIGLLLLTTALVDVAAFRYMREHTLDDFSFSGRVLYSALFISQINLATIWVTVGPRPSHWRWGAVVLATLGAVWLSTQSGFRGFSDAFVIFAGTAVILWLMLWCLMRTSFWWRLDGFGERPSWQFSLRQLLLLMTLLALLIVVLKDAHEIMTANVADVISFMGGSAFLALTAVLMEQTNLHRFVRVGSMFGIALVISALSCLVNSTSLANFMDAYTAIGSFFLIQTGVLTVWLTLGPIVPSKHMTPNGDV